jgi:hypothetical protein
MISNMATASPGMPQVGGQEMLKSSSYTGWRAFLHTRRSL